MFRVKFCVDFFIFVMGKIWFCFESGFFIVKVVVLGCGVISDIFLGILFFCVVVCDEVVFVVNFIGRI